MKIKLNLALIACVVVLTFNQAQAQTAAPVSSNLKAAEEMLVASDAGGQFVKQINATLAQTSTMLPEDKRAKFAEVMKTFITKYCSWESIKGDIAAIYAREFTEPELKELTAFYKTPLGKKLNDKMPLILAASSAIGQKMVMDHQTELQQMVMDAMK